MPRTDLGTRILKVNHAGEFGAISIYTGQIWMAHIRARDLVPELVEFRSHEYGHRAIFAAELECRGQRRCRSYALCGAGGFVLGILTGLAGRSAISATTVAVESVVLRHLEEQLRSLQDVDGAAVAAISSIVSEEREHHDRSSAQIPATSFWHRSLRPIIEGATEAVIWFGMRL